MTPATAVPLQNCDGACVGEKNRSLRSLVRQIDCRLIIVGALLPDIIDKPVGTFLFRDFFSNGRIFCHTLLFLLILSVAAVYMYRRQAKLWVAVLAFGTFVHLVLDQMWLTKQTFLWPVFGWGFERIEVGDLIYGMLHDLGTKPDVYIPELIGFVILVNFTLQLIGQKRVMAFFRNGTVL